MPVSPKVLCLLDPDAVEVAEAAAAACGLQLVRAEGVQDLLGALSSATWAATILSLSAEHVDEQVASRVGDQGSAGALVLTAPAVSLERALLMDRVGAVGLLREPLDHDELASRLAGILDEGREVALPGVSLGGEAKGTPLLVGQAPAMGSVFETIARIARSKSTVLITGESGTGKEVVARTLHWASERRDRPFVAVNCAAIPEHLLESELFGHERGAFTGAVARRVGRVERASGGTLFLDEIGDMSLVLQAKVLRVLEDGVIERVGGDTSAPIDVRVIAATNQRLDEGIRGGRFREDLYYRLAVVEIGLPPLRERGDDIRLLALHFGAHFAARHGKPVRAVSESALRKLEGAEWPGNVRELRNVMDRAVLLAQDDVIRSTDLRLGRAAPTGAAPPRSGTDAGYAPGLSLEEVEADHIRRTLESLDGHIAQAAASLGIHRNTLARKLKQYGIDPGPSDSVQQ